MKDSNNPTANRGEWGGQLEFILTCVGYAVGLGNVWRFPYLCYRNGGGAFLIPYVLMLALVGLPIFFMELSFGQFASLGPIAIWKASPGLKGLGIAMVLVDLFVALYYNVIVAWCFYYTFASMTLSLPWKDCNNSWNTKLCIGPDLLQNETALNQTMYEGNFTRSEMKSPSEEYFYNKVLKISSGIEEIGDVDWHLLLCLLAAWLVVYLVLSKGIASLGKVVYFTSTFPYVLLTAMLIRGVTLDGSKEGILYYLKPDFSKLLEANVWADAAVQIFFSLSTCTGGLIAMASFNKFHNNCLSFYSGFVIFSVLGFMAKEKGVKIEEVAAAGPGLVFVVYPEECVLSACIDEFPQLKMGRRETYFRIGACTLFFGVGVIFVTNAITIFKALQHEPLSLFGHYVYPNWSMNCGWILVAFQISFIPLVFVLIFMRNNGFKVLKHVLSPSKNWQPAQPENRVGRYSANIDDHVPIEIRLEPISKQDKDVINKEGLYNAGFHPDKF
ncbi:DgyrCDS11013 [Dimorphilus gyrociliatus]|uniref:Transporter n=1 Tax=Dimorphilus gyrociliatus TaxID=2664684 RepID=A0A7I8W3E7_9ANNE|nr:DgyrCDS11013 [Dimorphilus gyrociliatus]